MRFAPLLLVLMGMLTAQVPVPVPDSTVKAHIEGVVLDGLTGACNPRCHSVRSGYHTSLIEQPWRNNHHRREFSPGT